MNDKEYLETLNKLNKITDELINIDIKKIDFVDKTLTKHQKYCFLLTNYKESIVKLIQNAPFITTYNEKTGEYDKKVF